MNIKLWWDNLAERERKIVLMGGAIVFVLIIDIGIWSPLSTAVSDNKMQMRTEQQVLIYLKHALQTIAQLKREGVTVHAIQQGDLLAVAEQSLSAEKLSVFLKQVNQLQSNQIDMTFKAVPFDALMHWIQTLSEMQGVFVRQFTATKSKTAGAVNATVMMIN